jgi:nucleotide-binding universal stress UspA family protein
MVMVKVLEHPPEQVQADRVVELKNILVATDFSLVSDRALDYAISLARRYESRIVLAHVVATGGNVYLAPEMAAATHESGFSMAQEEMGQVLISGKLRGVDHETVIEEGPFWPVLEALITKHNPDLVVVGTHNVKGLEKFLLGSVAEQIFRQTKRPVLSVGPAVEGKTATEAEFKNILFATDFGMGAEREAAFAFSLAQEHGANLTMLHVVTHAQDYSRDGLALKRDAIFHELAELVPPGSEFWCKPEFRMRLGEPAREILEVAREMKADLVVMGAKKQTGFTAGHSLNTVAYRVVAAAPCPVLTVRS